MISKELDHVTDEDLKALIDNAVAEGRTLEFKSRLPGRTDADKREFLADVSSFANAAGGDLIYGIMAEDGVAKEVCGLGGFNPDPDIGRLENSVRLGIAPRIPSIRFKDVLLQSGKAALIVRIARSWQAPHMVTFKNLSRFFTRTSKGKSQLDVTEIRAAFLASETLAQRVERFLDERLARIIADDTPALLGSSPRVILHVVPFAGVALSLDWAGTTADALDASRSSFSTLCAGAGPCSSRINVDGLLSSRPPHGRKAGGYCQVFRSGAVEAVEGGLLDPDPVGFGGEEYIVGGAFLGKVEAGVRRYAGGLQVLGVPPPVVVRAALTGVKGWALVGLLERRPAGPTLDRDPLILPSVILEDLSGDVDDAVKSICDSLWNAAGRLQCDGWDSEGRRR